MSGGAKVTFIVALVILLVGLGLAVFYLSQASQQAVGLNDNLTMLMTENAELAEDVEMLVDWNSYQSTQIGAQQIALESLAGDSQEGPPEIPPPITLTPWDRPVGVMIEEGNCCVGGTAGETIEVRVQFLPNQTDLAGPAVEMRVITGVATVYPADMVNLPWEPFVEEAVYPVYLAINWTTFWVHVQYRTAAGAVSALYSDEIGVEGMPGVTESP